MTVEQNTFLSILSDHINTRHTSTIPSIDWDVLQDIAQAHQMEPIVFYQTQYDSFENAFMAQMFAYVKQKRYLDKIKSDFCESEISFFIVKGPEISCYYPNPPLRTMGDVDIVVKNKDKKNVAIILERHGFIQSGSSAYEMHFSKSNMTIEIHDHLIYKKETSNEKQVSFFADFWNHVENGKLEINYHFLYVLAHLQKHFLNEGVGFRQFYDLAMMQKNGRLDWDWIKQQLEIADMVGFAKTCFSLCSVWFDVKMPMTVSLGEQFIENATKSIFANGLFGFDVSQNRYNRSIVKINNSGENRFVFFRKKAVRLILPSYDEMRMTPKYNFVDKRPLLLPVAWIYRWGWIIKNKPSAIRNGFRYLFVSKKTYLSRNDYLRNWGIYKP